MSATPWLLGLAWGLLVWWAARAIVVGLLGAGRVGSLAPRKVAPSGDRERTFLVKLAPVAWIASRFRSLHEARRSRAARERVARELPVVVDLLGVGCAAGLTPYLAVEHAARWAPSGLAGAFAEVLRRNRLGVPFEEALTDVGRDLPGARGVFRALAQATRSGEPVGGLLERLASEARADIRRRAEARARSLSVRLLFPLVFLVLPAFVLLVVVPTLIRGFAALGA